MTSDRHTPLTGHALLEMLARDVEAVASLACEGIQFTKEEEAVFADMAHRGLSYDDRIAYLKAYVARTVPALAAE